MNDGRRHLALQGLRRRVFSRSGCCVRAVTATIRAGPRHEGVVEEITVIRHMLGQTDWQPRRIANVRTVERSDA